ncbi:MAG: molybdenum cofactor guanylyltransferase MobA [Pseudomonadota bacterium]
MAVGGVKIAGVILAGGLARRMGGGDKALLEVAGQPLLGHVIARLAPQVEALALNANGDAARFERFALPVLADTVEGFAGPLAGVLAGMRWAAEAGYTHVASAAGDTPFFPPDLVARLSAALGERDRIAIAATEDPRRGGLAEHPTFGLWPVDLADDLEAALKGDMRKVIVWASRHGCARAVFPEGAAMPFFNVNTPEDLAEAGRLAALHENATGGAA